MEKISVIACPAPGCGDVLMVFLMSIINRTQVKNKIVCATFLGFAIHLNGRSFIISFFLFKKVSKWPCLSEWSLMLQHRRWFCIWQALAPMIYSFASFSTPLMFERSTFNKLWSLLKIGGQILLLLTHHQSYIEIDTFAFSRAKVSAVSLPIPLKHHLLGRFYL